MHRPLEQLRARLQVLRSLDHARQPLADQACAFQCVRVGFRIVPLDVERLRAVREGIERRTDGLRPGQRHGECRLVHDSRQLRA